MIRLKTLGAPMLQRDDGPLGAGATQRRPLALLALLAVAGERGVSRDRLIAYLWSERGEERARHVLAQTLYALRRDVPGADVVVGTSDLRLNPEAIQSDVAEFEAALEGGDVERAASLYDGPFLDGFYVSDAPEFERWAEAQRARLKMRARIALERAARDATARGEHHRAVEWWRRVAALDPLDARAAVGLMEALAAIGDRFGALQHARVYETLAREELDVPLDPAVAAMAERLRTSVSPAAVPAPAPEPAPSEPPSAPAAAPDAADSERAAPGARASPSLTSAEGGSERSVPPPRGARRRWLRRAAVPAAVVLVALAVVGARSLLARRPAARVELPVVAVGAVRDYSGSDTSGVARALTDMLATNLARVPHLRVVSNARIYELLGRAGAGGDLAAQLGAAARRAGAKEMVEGALYRHRPGLLRFDVRRVDLATGAIRKAYSVEGADAFELVDRATAAVASDVRPGQAVGLHVADVTTRSLVAYRFYEEGLHAFYQQGNVQSARRLFLAAIGEDSTFAMAAYYAAKCEALLAMPTWVDRFVDAARLANRATERERLLIRAWTAYYWNQPSQRAGAETLATRYPDEPDGHYLLGQAMTGGGEFLAAVPHFRRVVEMDSLSLRGATTGCRACEALNGMIVAYWLADSLPAAERTAREWIRLQPGSTSAWATLVLMLLYQDRYEQMPEAMRMLSRLQGGEPDWRVAALMEIRRADLAAADSLIRRQMRENPDGDAPWFLTLSLRYQGRLREALAAARAARPREPGGVRSPTVGLPEAIVLADMGRSREAAAAFVAIAATPNPAIATPTARPQLRARYARDEAWNLTHAATALAAAGDTAAVARLADSIERVGALSAYGRDPRLHHYVRGLLLRARGQQPEAAEEFRRGLFSLTDGYTRNSYELARTLLALRRPNDALAVLRPALRGSLQGSNTYVTHTELHEAIAQAFTAAGEADSARAHYRWVEAAWRHADPQFRIRYEAARRALVR